MRDLRSNRWMPWALLLSFLAIAWPAMAQPRAWLDRDRVAQGESVTLHVEIPSATAAPPDYSALRRDFALSGHGSRRGVERSNGRMMAWTEYTVSLTPRRTGTLTIPSLPVAGGRTAPLPLQVTAQAPPTPAQAGAPVFIETVPDDRAPYVQQSVGWVVRLYSATPILSGQLDQPVPDGASLQRVGEDALYTRDIEGRRYQVFERRYLLVPERSGTLQVPGARFQGRAAPSLFEDVFGRSGDVLTARAPALSLRVQPIPPAAPQPWLPLHGLQLRYRDLPEQARAGQAATVTVEMRADGAAAAQLPELRLPPVEGAQVFPDPPQSDERQVDGRTRTVVTRRFAIVPTHAGELDLPALRQPWWDVGADRARSAALPRVVIPVSAAGATGAAAGSPSPSTIAAAEPAGVPAAPGTRVWIVAALAFAALWLATLLWALQRRAAPPAVPRVADGGDIRTPRATLAQLRHALDVGHFSDVETLLRAMAPQPAADLDAVASQLDDEAQLDAVDAMRRARWAGGDGTAARQQLREAFARGPRWKPVPAPEPALLPPLYPTGRGRTRG